MQLLLPQMWLPSVWWWFLHFYLHLQHLWTSKWTIYLHLKEIFCTEHVLKWPHFQPQAIFSSYMSQKRDHHSFNYPARYLRAIHNIFMWLFRPPHPVKLTNFTHFPHPLDYLTLFTFFYSFCQGWGCSLLVECLPSVQETLGSISCTAKKKSIPIVTLAQAIAISHLYFFLSFHIWEQSHHV
jgi:hypothetical protein